MGGGPLRIPGGGPCIDGVLPRPLGIALPLNPFVIGLGGGAEESRTGGAFPAVGDVTTASFLCWLTIFKL
jgi:hypothetical protein